MKNQADNALSPNEPPLQRDLIAADKDDPGQNSFPFKAPSVDFSIRCSLFSKL